MNEVDVHLLYIGCNSLREGRAEVGIKIKKKLEVENVNQPTSI
jgi:hypothetical protein